MCEPRRRSSNERLRSFYARPWVFEVEERDGGVTKRVHGELGEGQRAQRRPRDVCGRETEAGTTHLMGTH